MKEKAKENYGVARYFLLVMALSFIGWVFETVYMLVATGKFSDRGFLSLPFCPIYGCSIIAIYFLIDTPNKKSGVGKIKYLLLAFLIPSIAELLVGWIFDKGLNVRLWDYRGKAYNLYGYVCLRNSVAWPVLIYFFMRYMFLPIKNKIEQVPKTYANRLALFLVMLIAIDFSYNLVRVIYLKA